MTSFQSRMLLVPSLNSIVSRLHARHLRLLIALEEEGSLLAGAESIGLSQSGASKALQEIEATLGGPLFERTNRGLAPNRAGRCAVRYARLVYIDLAHLRDELEDIEHGEGGRLVVGVIMGAVPLLTRSISAFIDERPDVSIEVVEDTSAALLAQIEAGRMEVAICRTSVSDAPEMFEFDSLQDESLAVIAHKAHPLSGRDALDFEALSKFRWIVYRVNMPMRKLLEHEFQQAGVRFPRHLLETTSVFTTLTLLQENPSFVALVSTDVAHFFGAHGLTTILPVSIESRSEPYELVRRKTGELSANAKRLRDLLLHNDKL